MRNYVHRTNQKTSIPINVSVKDNYGNVVASGNYTTAGTYSLSFTPASTSATYSLEFYMTKASAFCFFRVDDVLVSYDDTTTVTVCKEVEDGYRYGFNGQEKDDQVSGKGNSYTAEFWQYDSRLGRRWNVDPKAAKFPSWSPYVFCLNNPILLMDPDGQEPIKPQAGTVSGFIAFLNNTSTKMGTLRGSAAQDAMYRLAKVDWSGGKPTPATTAPFNLQADRYIYTEKGGWMDMSHFMFYAGTAYKYKQEKLAAQKAIDNMSSGPFPSTRIPDALYKTAAMDPVGEAVQDGYQQEMGDKLFAKWSSYSYEDLPTDKFAADFGANYFDPNSKLSLGEQIQNYLNNNLKATTPDKAPNYNSLPSVEPTEKPSRTNHSTKPVYTKDNP